MKGGKKEPEAVEWVMQVLRADYAKVLLLVEQQKAEIARLPEGKKRRFFERDLADWDVTIKGQLEFKKNIMTGHGIEDDPRTFMFSEELLEAIYEKIKNISFQGDDSNMPSASA